MNKILINILIILVISSCGNNQTADELYSNAEVDDLWLNKAKQEPNDTKRNNAMAKIQDILMKEVVIAPVIENDLQWAMTDKLSGVGFHPEQSLRWFDLRLAD